MDELLIDDKKYVSSKRAAKVTGYAKDYIGQLCREGRVPARLVGRSWYVLESAIQDHRFGSQTSEVAALDKVPEEAPRYAAATIEAPAPLHQPVTEANLPPAVQENALAEEKGEKIEEKELEPGNHLADWRSWFDQIAEIAPMTSKRPEAAEEETLMPQERVEELVLHTEEGTEVPIHTVYELSEEPLLPYRNIPVAEEIEEETHGERTGVWRRLIYTSLQSLALLLAVGTAATAVLGSGYIDKYMSSFSQASVISGIIKYEK